VELRHLRYFIKAAELLNFTKAAESLYVSQPTLSVQIHQLEQELGTELFARVGRNVHLTESGKVFLARANKAVKELEEGGREVDAIKGLLRGNMCVGSLPLYGSKIMTPWIAAFSDLYPDVFIKVTAGTSEDIEAGILAGDIDVGLAMVPAQHPDIMTRELFRDEIVLVASKTHALAKKKKLSVSDFQNLSMALPSERISAAKLLGPYFEQSDIQPKVVLTYEEGHSLLELVKRGKFITFLPLSCVKSDPDLCSFPLPAPGMPISTGMLWTNLTPAAQAFLDLATEQAKQLVMSI
jgi:LysR family cyn operon transcriptional activator